MTIAEAPNRIQSAAQISAGWAAESEINLFLPKAYSHGGGLLDGGTTYVTASWGSESFFKYSTFRTEPAWGSL